MRTTAMGDVAMLPHALRALCAAYPDLHITVATQPFLKPFFRGLNVGFLDVKTKDEHHSVVGMWRLAREARALGVDAVAEFPLPESLRQNPFLRITISKGNLTITPHIYEVRLME